MPLKSDEVLQNGGHESLLLLKPRNGRPHAASASGGDHCPQQTVDLQISWQYGPRKPTAAALTGSMAVPPTSASMSPIGTVGKAS